MCFDLETRSHEKYINIVIVNFVDISIINVKNYLRL